MHLNVQFPDLLLQYICLSSGLVVMANHRPDLPPDLSMSEDEDTQPLPCLSQPSYSNRVESEESDDSIVYLAQAVGAGDHAAGDGAASLDVDDVDSNSTAAPGDVTTDSGEEGAEGDDHDVGQAPPPLLNSDVLSK